MAQLWCPCDTEELDSKGGNPAVPLVVPHK